MGVFAAANWHSALPRATLPPVSFNLPSSGMKREDLPFDPDHCGPPYLPSTSLTVEYDAVTPKENEEFKR